MRALRPSKAADILANIVSPPTAGTSLAHKTVAIGGSARNVSSECHTSVPNGGFVPSFLNLMRTGVFGSCGENGCTVNSPKRRPKSIRLSREFAKYWALLAGAFFHSGDGQTASLFDGLNFDYEFDHSITFTYQTPGEYVASAWANCSRTGGGLSYGTSTMTFTYNTPGDYTARVVGETFYSTTVCSDAY
jgi:hypothetical protein